MNNNLEQGDIITLSDNKEYIVFATTSSNGKNYVYLMTTKEPIEICFAEQTIINNQLDLRILSNQDEKIAALNLFRASYADKQVDN